MTTHPPPFTPLEPPRRLLVAVYAAVSLWYLAWRAGTFNAAAPAFSSLIYAAELFGFGTALLHVFMCWRLTERHAPPPRPGIGVDVFVPTYDEPVDLVRKTLLAARSMEYPHRTWLLDDGRREEMRALARQLGCEYLARGDNAHAKAGNLNHALAHSTGELVVVFDADHAPRRDFLLKTLGYFEDARVAFVQTPQDFYNLDSYQHRRRGMARTVWTEQALFFRVIQRGKDYWNAAFFCGSCAVVRRSALEEIGGFATGTVTEDLHTSIRLHARGHRSVYHAEPLAFGLAPESIEPFIGQRVRWGQGAMHVWRLEGILTHRGLTLAQRLNYFASALTYFDGWQKGIFYFAPAVVLLTGLMPLVTTTSDFLLHFLPYYALTFWVFEEVGRGYGRSVFTEQYNMARFAAFAWATLAWVLPPLRFKVTPKGRRTQPGATRFTVPQWSVALVNCAAVPLGVGLYLWLHWLPLDGLIANVVWGSVNAALAVAVIAFTAVTQRNARSGYRFPVPLSAEVVTADGARARGTVDDLSEHGLRFYGRFGTAPAIGDKLTGHVLLPEGPVPFWGEVRSRAAADAEAGSVKAVGCRFDTSDEGRRRLEEFLFGSNLQWVLNGYTDRVHTPMSRWLPRHVEGPSENPLATLRWNAAQVRVERDGPSQAVLLSAAQPGDEVGAVVVSHDALPEHRPLILDAFRRTDMPSQRVTLEPMRLAGAQHPDVFAYRVATRAPEAAATHAPGDALARPRHDAEPSTY